MQLLRDIIFVLWRTLLAEKVDTFERHIHKKGCLEYCLFMYSVAFFSLRNQKISSLKLSQILQKPFLIRHTPVKRSKKYFLQHACPTDTYQIIQKNFKKSGRKVWSVMKNHLPLHPLSIRKATHKERKILEIMQTNK